MNTDELESATYGAERRVLEIQAKLHRWARDDPHRRFDDLFNLVADPAFLLVAWDRVRGNKGAKTAGVDGATASSVALRTGVEEFLDGLRASIKDRSFRPLPVRERMIPKAGGKLRRLGIATITDRVVQASLKLVLEPIFEADFLPCSYGFRPNRRAHDAVAEVRFFTSKKYEWIVEGDIKACFDEISHSALLDRVRARVGDKRVLDLVKAFLKAGILGEDCGLRDTTAGTPQGSILSPLLSNVALSVLDEYIAAGPGGPAATAWQRAKRRSRCLPNYRLSRYADDWCLMVHGSRDDAEALREEIAEVLSTMGLRLSPEKTLITHIDQGLDFLGWHIQRHRKRGTRRCYVYTYPSRKAVTAAMGKVKAIRRRTATGLPLDDLLIQMNRMLVGSPGVPGLLHDVALKRFTESFCNTFATCGACCRRCSEPCPSRTCNICNTLNRRRRRTHPTPTCTFRQDAAYARFAPRENRGWCMYFRPGVSSATFQYLSSYVWGQVMKWLRCKHRRINRKDLRRRYCGGGWWPAGEERTLFDPGKVRTTRYRYRGTVIPSPWPTTG